MNYRILEYGFHHRNTYADKNVWFLDIEPHIAGICVVIGKLQSDGKWWIVPKYMDDKERMEDLGPYDTFDEAIFHLMLMKDPEDDNRQQ